MARYQNGTVTKVSRKNGMAVWLFRWNDRDIHGLPRPRKKVLGDVKSLPANSKVLKMELDRMRLMINTESNPLRRITIDALVNHFKEIELVEKEGGRAYSTRDRMETNLDKWILPRWGKVDVHDVKAVDVEAWLEEIDRAPGTKAKIRDNLSVLFAHAKRWRWVTVNPIDDVRQSGKRAKEPDILTIDEMRSLIATLGTRERAMVFLDMVTGIRRGELAGLKWGDVDFVQKQINITRSVVDQNVGNCKTEVSRKPMPLDDYTAEAMLAWRSLTPYTKPEDWVWATDSNRAGKKSRGKQPLWLSRVMQYHIQPKGREVGITKPVGWHMLRHTFSTLLSANREDVKVVQELMRHSTSKMTLDTYTQALTPDKREAQGRIATMLMVQ